MKKYCKNCGIYFTRRPKSVADCCSDKCAREKQQEKRSVSVTCGTFKVETYGGKIVVSRNFQNREELLELMDLFSTAPVLIVMFDSKVKKPQI